MRSQNLTKLKEEPTLREQVRDLLHEMNKHLNCIKRDNRESVYTPEEKSVIFNDYFEKIKSLISTGKVNEQDENGNTLLHLAVLYEDEIAIPLIELLIKHGAKVNIANHFQQIPLVIALWRMNPCATIISLLTPKQVFNFQENCKHLIDLNLFSENSPQSEVKPDNETLKKSSSI
jgi:ankyrin repeat protein